jgi:hypothetical protein
MTTFAETEKICCVCGNSHKYIEITSSNQFGAPDLDTRPSEMLRSTISAWIQSCLFCGYCAPDISKGPQIASQVIKSDAYENQKINMTYPELASKFLCWALIQEAAGEYGNGGWTAVQAAWVCDDDEAELQAKTRCYTVDEMEEFGAA